MTDQQLIANMRKGLHKRIVYRMFHDFHICTTDNLIEDFKRAFLWDHCSVETSRSLDMKGLETALSRLNILTLEQAVTMMQMKYTKYASTSDFLMATKNQTGKIIAINAKHLKLSYPDLLTYIEKTLERKVYPFNMTMAEAHHLIERLEKWESNILRKK
ncbi:TPA: hypothetical protein DD449_03975 [Candidatus Berkelbacteria bacterium]|nr:hypothetical protein [Candidatus Berkelbacteria bacterium]